MVDPVSPKAKPIGRPPTADPTGPVVVSVESVSATALALAEELAASFAAHVKRSLGVTLDRSETSLAFVDHYLRQARNETRGPILQLLAAEAGAYYGEVVRESLGAQWIGTGGDPRTLRMLVRHQFLYFAPVDQALEVLLAGRDPGDGLFEGDTLDTQFHPRSKSVVGEDDEPWLAERLAELPPVADAEFYSLTCRFETLKLVLELLAAKHGGEGQAPREYGISDYLEALAAARA